MIKPGHTLSVEEVARRYEELKGHRGMPLEFYDRVLDVVGPLSGLRVVDVGGGGGSRLRKAAARWPKAELWGVDVVLPEPPIQGHGIRVVVADLRGDLPFQSQSM